MPLQWNQTPKDQQLTCLQLPELGTPLSPQACQALAVRYALKGLGRVAPNPLVGSVIVDGNHRFLAAGAHRQAGHDHGEIDALVAFDASKSQADLRQATLYVTLEPCAHQNKTPACAPRLAARHFRRVVYGVTDPNLLVNGKGAAILKSAGVACEQDLDWQAACEDLAEIFLWNAREKRPFLGLKAAITLNGALGRRGDQRHWLTGARARQYGHFLRVYFDGIVIGAETALSDDPTLDTRDSLVVGRNPKKIVLDPSGRALRILYAEGNLAKRKLLTVEPEKVIWVINEDAATSSALGDARQSLQGLGARLLVAPSLDSSPSSSSFDLEFILKDFYQSGLTSLLLEGGAGTYKSFLQAGLVNKIYLFQSPKVLTGGGLINWADGGVTHEWCIEGSKTLTPLGDDWLIEGLVKKQAGLQQTEDP